MCQSEIDGCIQDSIIFIGGDSPVQLRVERAFVIWGVLAHEGEKHLPGAEGLCHPVDTAPGVLQLPGEEQVADQHAGFQLPALHPVGAGLAKHL